MASLTSTISTVNSGKPIIDPGPADPGFLGAVANFASGAIDSVSAYTKDRDRRKAQSDQDSNDKALDTLVGDVHDLRREAAQGALSPSELAVDYGDSPSNVPASALMQADGVLRVKRAVEQGRATPGTLDMRIENLVTSLNHQFPESRYEIAVAMKGLGIDHYVFRDEIARRDFQDAGQAAQIATMKTQIDFAAQRGLVTATTKPEDAAEIGRLAMAELAKGEAAKARSDQIRADRTLSLQEQEAKLKQTGAEVQASLIGQAALSVAPLIDATTLALSAAGTDAERQTALGQFRVQTQAALTAYRSRGVVEITAAGGGTDEVKGFTDYVDSQVEAVNSLYNTSFEQNIAASKNLAAALNIDMGRAMPIYSRIQAAIGPAAASAVINGLDGVPGLDPKMIEAAKKELTQFDPTSPRGVMSIARAIGYLRGEVGLKDLTSEEAVAYIRTNATALRANQTAVLSGNTAALDPWKTTYANTVEAVVELAPTTTTPASLASASTQFATPEARRALDLARKDDPEFGGALTQSSRAAAAKMISMARSVPSKTDGPFTTSYNDKMARFEATLTREAYDKYLEGVVRQRQMAVGAVEGSGQLSRTDALQGVPSYAEMQKQVPESVNQRLTALNNGLAHLILTDQYDPAIPKTLTGKERSRMYATGATPTSLRQGAEGNEWERIRGNLDAQIQDLLVGSISPALPPTALPPKGELQEKVRTRGEALGLSWNLVERVVRRESSWDAGATNESTKARGLFQINDDNSTRSLDENINDGLNLLKDAQEDAQRVLKRAPQDWEVYVAHQQGPGGGPALLDPANASKNAVDVLTPLYPSKSLARQAVTNNGGNVNMTAAQFLQSIRKFYEGK